MMAGLGLGSRSVDRCWVRRRLWRSLASSGGLWRSLAAFNTGMGFYPLAAFGAVPRPCGAVVGRAASFVAL